MTSWISVDVSLVYHHIGLSLTCLHFLDVIMVEEKLKGKNLERFERDGKVYTYGFIFLQENYDRKH